MDLRGLDKEWRGFSDLDIKRAKVTVSTNLEDASPQPEKALVQHTAPNPATALATARELGVEVLAISAQTVQGEQLCQSAEVELRER